MAALLWGCKIFHGVSPHDASDTVWDSWVSPAQEVPCCAAPAFCGATVGIWGDERCPRLYFSPSSTGEVPVAEHPPGGPVAGHTGEESGAVQPGQPCRLPGVHERRASPQPGGSHHPTGTAGKCHQNHQRAADGHVCQPAQSPRPLRPGTLTPPPCSPPPWSCCAQPVPFNRFGSAYPAHPVPGVSRAGHLWGHHCRHGCWARSQPTPRHILLGVLRAPICQDVNQSCPRVLNQGRCRITGTFPKAECQAAAA